MPKKRIIFVTREIVPFYYGGIGTQFKAVAKFLKSNGHEIYFLTQRHKKFDEKIYNQHYGDIPLFFVNIPEPTSYVSFSPTGGLVSTFSLAYALAVSKKFDDIYKTVSPDIVICADFGGEGLFLFLKSYAGDYEKTRFILTINGMLFDVLSAYESGMNSRLPSELNDPQNRITCAMESLCILLAYEIVSPTAVYWDEIQTRLKINKEAYIIPNFVDSDLFNLKKDDESNVRENQFIIFIGRLDRLKGADILLNAYLDILENESNIKHQLIFIGRDSFWKEHESTFLEYWQKRIPDKCASNISFLGQVDHDQIITYLRQATVCVFPSRWEVFGIVCLEAMFYGCPVLVSQGTGLEELLGPSFSKYTFDVTEGKIALKQKLISILENSSELCKVGAGLRKRAGDLINMSKSHFLEIIKTDVKRESFKSNNQVMQLYDNTFELLSAMSDISYFIGTDYQKLKGIKTEKKKDSKRLYD